MRRKSCSIGFLTTRRCQPFSFLVWQPRYHSLQRKNQPQIWEDGRKQWRSRNSKRHLLLVWKLSCAWILTVESKTTPRATVMRKRYIELLVVCFLLSKTVFCILVLLTNTEISLLGRIRVGGTAWWSKTPCHLFILVELAVEVSPVAAKQHTAESGTTFSCRVCHDIHGMEKLRSACACLLSPVTCHQDDFAWILTLQAQPGDARETETFPKPCRQFSLLLPSFSIWCSVIFSCYRAGHARYKHWLALKGVVMFSITNLFNPPLHPTIHKLYFNFFK